MGRAQHSKTIEQELAGSRRDAYKRKKSRKTGKSQDVRGPVKAKLKRPLEQDATDRAAEKYGDSVRTRSAGLPTTGKRR
ncbi:hypothetical protein CDG81_17950 [Actinopolyspora erythraea]|uniref:Uncharacterized protein n=1 Tax=Actinopolyspora erythraea TaxID=414996 RepID=A0A099D0U1_9ACTN|nr:hypothetical protein [Actinopolyspora erythraea]ASU79832.1 hypothetical protein CDG81_17950 [Actinopolyspora erythraea]KGI79649.1 hypothetical protein IL38_22125 [Actinopolyspora erythraea]